MTRQAALLVRLSAAGVLLGLAPLSAQESDPPVVVTAGEAIIRAVPDRAYVAMAAEARATTPAEAQRQSAEAMTAVQEKLREAGIPADAIRTLGFELHPEFDYVNGRQSLRGYLARNRIEVRIDQVERVGQTIDLAIGAGANSIGAIRFDLRDRDKVEREALSLAVADARARAEAAAAGAGQSVDRILRIEEQRAMMAPPRPVMMAMRADVAEAAETPIAPGELEVRAQVTLTVAIRGQ